jgi:N-acetylmuramoyl-L-alanine amidase
MRYLIDMKNHLNIRFKRPELTRVVFALLAFLIFFVQTASAQSASCDSASGHCIMTPGQAQLFDTGVNYFNLKEACDSTSTSGASVITGDLDRYLQVLAYQESSGNPTVGNPSGASGKYQYINSTWQSSGATYYPPANAYATASSAPEPVQDAVAYLEYTAKFKALNGDIFKLAVSHFYPKANDDPSFLDIVPPENVDTPRQYAEGIINKLKTAGPWDQIQLHYKDAPEFATYLAKGGGAYTGSSAAAAGTTTAAAASTSATTSATGTATGDAAATATAASGSAAKPVIVLDPGASGTVTRVIDPTTGLIDYDGPSNPQADEMYKIALAVKAKLETDGYTVTLTKKSATDTVSPRGRATIANQAHADLAVSIHDDHTQTYDSYAQVYTQNAGDHRDTAAGKQVKFSDAAIAGKSNQYGQVFAAQRGVAESHKVTMTHVDYTNQPGISPGNIPLEQLYANVPWVYNEIGAAPAGQSLNSDEQDAYTKGIVAGVEGSIPVINNTSSCGGAAGSNGAVVGSIIQTAENYAWDTYVGHTSLDSAKQSYKDAWAKYDHASDMTDCSAFVATVMISSGVDKNYPKAGTATQMDYVKAHPEKYKIISNPQTTGQLKPGDILIHDLGGNGHTLIYIGDPKWQGADASLGGHTPQVSPDVTWMFSESNDIAVEVLNGT